MTQGIENNVCKIFTIGFTKKSAKEFFGLIKCHNINSVIDIRLNNQSQLAGFTKKNDLIFFLDELCNCSYQHKPLWAPNEKILSDYKKKSITWNDYERLYLDLLNSRDIISNFSPNEYMNACLLCSEPLPNFCHRRLLAEFLQKKYTNIVVIHI
ncbi:DUF488 family protein [Desulfovibrio desulfuricans]|uniref:DUF488 domain-containing protein n=1 Tax=Desulfovibrio desulfuricans TaxID=876 RepID=UPI001AE6AE30|nr:DUF488 domain-containing protein [Desulfovibrio desulfuricans]QTO40593.1 DUF488 domain-containing protein [Desulfovibrio desulfuricans]